MMNKYDADRHRYLSKKTPGGWIYDDIRAAQWFLDNKNSNETQGRKWVIRKTDNDWFYLECLRGLEDRSIEQDAEVLLSNMDQG